jgi:sulfur-oxidizing protein SoxB
MLMDQTGHHLSVCHGHAELTGETIKTILEDVADNLFNPDPYYQQGGDMVRVGGLQNTLDPGAKMGARISDMRLDGRLIDAAKTYEVAGRLGAGGRKWRPEAGLKPVWSMWRPGSAVKTPNGRVTTRRINAPRLTSVKGNPGLAA